jgi:hypothetical protein
VQQKHENSSHSIFVYYINKCPDYITFRKLKTQLSRTLYIPNGIIISQHARNSRQIPTIQNQPPLDIITPEKMGGVALLKFVNSL